MTVATHNAAGEEIGKPSTPEGLILEAWAQGFMVGALIIMAAITVANMRRGVLLHKLILIELIFGTPHGTFMFADPPAYGWYLSVTAIFLNVSWSMHNIIAWMKSKPFLGRKVSIFYITTVLLVQPYWILEIYANFTYFNNINNLFHYTRPYEALFRDPWWVFTVLNLFWNIKRRYEFPILELIRVSPRFGILLLSMTLSVGFIIVDILSVTPALAIGLPDGINPFWKLAFVFKCFTDTIILDDFKTALDRLKQYKLRRLGSSTMDAAQFTDVLSGGGDDWREWRRADSAVSRGGLGLGVESPIFSPWNESRGVTSSDAREGTPALPKKTLDQFDLEMAYWTRRERQDSAGNDLSPCASRSHQFGH